ncbi:CD151 antigen-like [Acropora millepora]|uniref:CD151 antigen-like n=1 Tax=Acropora millepora TaxID=45264 RepID=UPI001CF182FA|nr:CD151 antigen-like [Acropora millepora]XP_044181926.1 CD151 antigen-like [Acropora millepora]
MGRSVNYATVLLCGFGFPIYLGISGALLCLAFWLNNKFGDISKITTDTYSLVPCGILFCVGVVIFLTTLFACGGWNDSKCWLSISVFLFFIALALEVAAGVMGYIYHIKAEGYLNEGLIDAIKNYDPRDGDSSLEQAMDSLQKNLKCCGSRHPNDWYDSKYYSWARSFPKSCCSRLFYDLCFSSNWQIHKEGCLNKLTDEVKHYLNYLLGTAIGLSVFQLLGIVGTFYLMRRGREQRYLKMEAGTNRVTEDMNQLIQRTNSINDDDATDDVPVSSDHPS